MKYVFLALILISTSARAFTISTASGLDYTLFDPAPDDSHFISLSIDDAIFNYPAHGTLTAQISGYFADPGSYRIDVLGLDIIFMDSHQAPEFQVRALFPTGYSVVHTKQYDGNSGSGYSAVSAVTDSGTLKNIGQTGALAYELRHLSGDIVPGDFSSPRAHHVEHNLSMRVTKVPEPSSLALIALSMLGVFFRQFLKTRSGFGWPNPGPAK